MMSQLVEGSLHPDSRFRFQRVWSEGARPVDYARNLMVQKFLASDCDRLWFMDADTVPPPDVVKLLNVDADIVSGVTPTWGNQFANEPPAPGYTIYAYDETQRGMLHRPVYNDGIEDVDGVGTAMMLIKRHVLEDRRLWQHPGYIAFDGTPSEIGDDDAPPVFREVRKPNGQLDISEDLDFCFRAKRLGYRIAVHHGAKCHHHKRVDVLAVIDWGLRHAESVIEEQHEAAPLTAPA